MEEGKMREIERDLAGPLEMSGVRLDELVRRDVLDRPRRRRHRRFRSVDLFSLLRWGGGDRRGEREWMCFFCACTSDREGN